MGKHTPIARKAEKSTPKTVPKKLKTTPNKADVAIELKRASIRRTKLDLKESTSFDVTSICTPTRTTRSMSRYAPDDMLQSIPSFVTPSKRNTIAIAKTSAKKSLVKVQANALDGEFVRPRTPKIKINDVTLGNDTTIDESTVPMVKRKRQSVKTHKAAKMPEKQAESSEDDLPSVSMLVRKSSAKKAGKFVRSRKSFSQSNNDIESADEENLPSVSILGQNSSFSTQMASKSVRSRKSLGNNNFVETTDDEDLPSVSILASQNSPGRYARSPQWLQDNAIESNENEKEPNSSTVSPVKFNRSRKSFGIVKSPATESNENGSNENRDHNKSSKENEPLAAVDSTAENGSKTGTTSDSTILEPAVVESQSTRRSEQGVKDQTESSDDGAVSILGALKPARKSVKKCTAEPTIEPIQDEPSSVKRTVKFTSPIIIETPKTDLDASYTIESDNHTENEEKTHGKNVVLIFPSQNGDKKPLVTNNRVSIVDLTDSPVHTNCTLNTTFSPAEALAADDNEATNRTFNEDDKKVANDKTFSPVPSIALKAAYSSPLLVLSSPSTSVSKKMSPQLKRLKGTPMRKPGNNLNTPGKLSSAKKAKMFETALELCDSSAKQKMKPKLNASTPKVFRFGAVADEGYDFRFSLLAPNLNPNIQTQNSKYSHAISIQINFSAVN